MGFNHNKKVGQDDRTGKGLEGKEFLAALLTQSQQGQQEVEGQ